MKDTATRPRQEVQGILQRLVRSPISLKDSDAYYISSIGSSCDRQIQLRHSARKLLDDEEIILSHDRRQELAAGVTPAMVGTLLHDHITRQLGTVHGMDVEGQVEYEGPDGVRISGRYDFRLITPEGEFLGEIKTVSQSAQTHLPKPEHVDQLMLYMGILDIRQGVLVYVFRDASTPPDGMSNWLRVYDVALDQKRFWELVERFYRIQAATDATVLLPTLPHVGRKYPCGWCEWRELCK